MTSATALINTCEEVFLKSEAGLQRNSLCQVFRCIHLLTGDSVRTNDNAARRLLQHMRSWAPQHRMLYTLIVWLCASHQANLVVLVAICGGLVKDATKNDTICVACSRLCRHLMVDYSEEFSKALWM